MPIHSPLPDLIFIDVALHEYMLEGIRRFQHTIAFIDGDTGEKWTGKDVIDQSQSIAAGLQHKFGVKKNDAILFFLPNCPRHAIAILGTLSCGAVVSGCNHIYNSDELMRQITDSKPVVIFCDAAGINVVREAKRKARSQNFKIVILESNIALELGEYSLDYLLSTPAATLVAPPINTKTDLCLMPYSSGTTGLPKGTMITHYNKVTMLQTLINRAFFLCPVPGETIIGILPFFHLFGLMVLLPAMRDGVSMVTMRKFKPEPFFKHIQDYKAHYLYLVPPLVLLLAKHPSVSKYNLTSLSTIFVAAAPLGEQLSKDLRARLPHLKYLIQGYGMTECTGATTVMLPVPMDQLRYGSCGILVSNSEAIVVDIQTGKELGPNQTGELWWRGPGNMKGYLRKPEQTAATIDEQGWVHTGDIARYDDDGYFYIVDRLKELIKVKGFQVAPAELEDHLVDHPNVDDAAVVGVPDEKTGELPIAFVVKKPGTHADSNKIMKDINAKISSYKHLKAVVFVDTIPKSPSGKILRRILRDRLKNSKM